MKQRLVGLLRGINVGRAKRIAMADLRALLEELGYTDVETVLNSGNVIFTAGRGTPAAIASRIEAALPARLGVGSRVFMLTAAELARIIADNPIPAGTSSPSRYLVHVLASEDDAARLEPLAAKSWGEERLATAGRAAYVWCPAGILESALIPAVGKALGERMTARNWGTLCRLAERAGGGETGRPADGRTRGNR